MSLFDLFVTIGEGNRKFYEDSGVRPERLVDGGYFVDVPYFAAVAKREVPRRSILRERWKIPADAICFLFCGKCQAKKRPLDFIRSLALVSKEYPGRVHGLVAGTGELESQMRSVAELTGAAVTFAGFLNQSEIGTAYAAADCLVLPSDDRETWGLVTNEAMIFGLPAIVSDRVGCGPDLVKEGETGFTFPVGETEALAGRMSALLASPARIRTMGSAAQMQVASYSPERGARAVVEAMRRIEGGAF
jgi:glycosyltransferase involved in cell wall biosynthesis